jgi:hypothetical protein
MHIAIRSGGAGFDNLFLTFPFLHCHDFPDENNSAGQFPHSCIENTRQVSAQRQHVQLWAQLQTPSPSLFPPRPLPLLMDQLLPQNYSNKKRKRDEAQTNLPLFSIPYADPSILGPFNVAHQSPIRRGENEYVPAHPNPSTSATELLSEDQPVLIHEPSSIPRTYSIARPLHRLV